jgi:hypothetical protein
VSRGVGSMVLQRLWSHYDLALDYIGGAAYYSQHGLGWASLQQADVEQKITWKRGQLSLRDSFSYLPEGNFGGAYGSIGSQGISSLGSSAFGGLMGGSTFGTLGLVPRIVNVSVADVSQDLTPKSAFTAAGGYALTHFYGSDQVTGAPFIGSSQITGQAGYNRLLTVHTQIALVYAYEGFDFSVQGTSFHSHVIQGMYGHRISGRMDFLAGAGPQFTHIGIQEIQCSDSTIPVSLCLLAGDQLVTVTKPDFRIGVAARVRLRYRFPKTSLELSYSRYLSAGSGFFAGAQTDVARLSAIRPLNRVWSWSADIGYSRNSRLQALTSAQLATCVFPGQQNPRKLPFCPGVDANTYTYGFVGAALHRAFGRNFHGFVSYQFNEIAFDHSYCGGTPLCSRIGNRHLATFGLDWTPRPLRID